MPTYKPDLSLLSPTQLQQLTGKSYPTIRKRLGGLKPVRVDGKTRLYLAREALEAIFREDGDSTPLELQRERARLAKEQADKTAMENAEKRGDLVSSRVMAETWANLCAAIKSKFLGMPTRAAPLVMGCQSLPEVKEVLDELVYEVLHELSGMPLDGIDTEPEKVRDQRN